MLPGDTLRASVVHDPAGNTITLRVMLHGLTPAQIERAATRDLARMERIRKTRAARKPQGTADSTWKHIMRDVWKAQPKARPGRNSEARPHRRRSPFPAMLDAPVLRLTTRSVPETFAPSP